MCTFLLFDDAILGADKTMSPDRQSSFEYLARSLIYSDAGANIVDASLGIFQTQYEHVNLPTYSSSAISWIFTFQLFLIFFLSQINGIAVDMFGPRAVIIPAAAFEIFGLGMLSLSKEYYQIFLAQGVCFGIGAAGLFMPGTFC